MKKTNRIRIALALVAVATILVYSACADLLAKPVSISDRLSSFNAKLSTSDRSQVYTDLDESGVMYQDVKASSYWAIFPAGGAYTLVIKDSSNAAAVTAQVTSADKLFDYTVTFGMSVSGTINLIYKIKSISFTVGTTVTSVYK